MTISATPPSLIDGLRPLDRSFESWWVRPGSATAVEVRAGDRVTIRDPDGGQAAEVTVVPEALGLRMDAPATVLDNLPGDFLASLHASGVRPDEARAAVQRCREALAVFEAAALAADNDEERLAESGRRLTVVEDQP